ncbi:MULTISPECIES: PaaI family thioesterase [unclassified Nocardia]|uniref:PaaI family thioesterase n=1 Tax=unclassified Nocardia TaxID=2637762 RepID=UPI001CE44091|nr:MULTISPECIES: PaaI family thioesterase [unclassified Nocardia]
MTTTTPSLDLARAVLAAQPFSVLLGAELTAFDTDGATLEIPIHDNLRQQFGYVHGGVLAYLADNTITYAGGVALGPNVLTSGFTITYLRPADGVRLRAIAHVIDATGRQAVCACQVFAVPADGDPVLCATAQGTVRSITRERAGANVDRQ